MGEDAVGALLHLQAPADRGPIRKLGSPSRGELWRAVVRVSPERVLRTVISYGPGKRLVEMGSLAQECARIAADQAVAGRDYPDEHPTDFGLPPS